MKKKQPKKQVLNNIIQRAHYLANQMIFEANNRKDKEKGDPKVGGHSSATASAIHIMGALHLLVKSGFDHIANKPHASPADHSINYLLDNFLKDDLSKLSLDEANEAMKGLRAFSKNGEYVFQSYHSTYDSDHHNFFPSGTVGIPPVQAGYLAHAYRFAKEHGYEVPEAHFWSLIGDAEFREGSLFEAIPDFAEREIGNLTWMIDYNRQSLDGHRIANPEIMDGTDDMRIEKTMRANGWDVIQVRHGQSRLEYFSRDGGKEFQKWYENKLTDYELQSILLVKEGAKVREHLVNNHKKDIKKLDTFLKNLNDEELFTLFRDFGGHDIFTVAEALEKSKENPRKPTMIIFHTLKGWNLDMAAVAGNHSMLPPEKELVELRKATGLDEETLFARFEENTAENKFLTQRGEEIYSEIVAQHELKAKNAAAFQEKFTEFGEIPETLGINLKMASYPHTQWMLGQLTAKLTRIANTPLDESKLKEKQKPLGDTEKPWKTPAELLVSMAPDVGTSTNLNPAMDGKIFGADITEDLESQLEVKDKKTPDLIPHESENSRFLRFEIAEANVMSCMGSYGRLRDTLGIPLLPLMTVYDFFVKRALDQFFYDLYWKSSFILVGTPSGVTLSPEGAQHGWKSDIQIPNQITWEPFFCQELDWILCDSVKRHVLNDNEGRSGVFVRGVTRGVEQKDLMKYLKTQQRFKIDQNQSLAHKDYPVNGATDESTIGILPEAEIMSQLRTDVLNGGYYLIDYRGYAGYEPGDNVVNIFALGALGTEAIKASNELLEKGIYANVIIVTCTDLLIGNLGHENDYHHLKNNLGINADLHIQPLANGSVQSGELTTFAGRRVPIVSVHDGEPGLLDNIGSIIGVKHEALAVRKHSKCGRPSDIYKFHGIDSDSVVEACGKVLSETALEQIKISQKALGETRPALQGDWRQLWPTKH